jgi:hypothetical protein
MNQFINGINADGRDEISEEVFLTFANFRGYTRPSWSSFPGKREPFSRCPSSH